MGYVLKCSPIGWSQSGPAGTSIGRINALSPKTHAHWAIAATAFQPGHTEILHERAVLT
jgi:hypothetical protein